MKIKIWAVSHRTGTFNDKPYDNYQIGAEKDNGALEVRKMKADNMRKSGIKDTNILIGKEWEVYLDDYKNIDLIKVPE